MKVMTEVQKSILHTFAKSNKISHVKLEGLVNELFAALPKSGHQGRKPNEATVKLIKDIEEFSVTTQLKSFTVKELATQFKADAPTVTNILKRLSEQGKAAIVGKADKVVGVRGKVPALWAFKAAVEAAQ